MIVENKTVSIDYYTDILCVWAWIAQPRLEELHLQWGDAVTVRHRYIDIFGDSHIKIPGRWGAADGFEKFSAHVTDSVAPYAEVTIHPGLWKEVRPRSSMQSHLVLKAVELLAGSRKTETVARCIRQAFFSQAQDVGDMEVLLQLVEEEGLERTALETTLRDGSAMAALSSDQRSANELGVKGSPTWVLNQGRQVLYGNVGYRILSANIEELLKHPDSEASWC